MLVYLPLELVFSSQDSYDPASLALLTTFGLSSEVFINLGLKLLLFSQQTSFSLRAINPEYSCLLSFLPQNCEMSSSGFKWGFLKLPFREKKSFHQITIISNIFGQTPRYLQHPWSGVFLMKTCSPVYRHDKSGFTIIYGDDSA
ncbi:hypothetical protein ACFX13_000817 [Malus domestica]